MKRLGMIEIHLEIRFQIFCGKAWNDDNFCNFYARKRNLTTRRMLVITTYLPLILLKFFEI